VFDRSDIDISLWQNDEIETSGQHGLGSPKGFTDEPLPTVADDGIADFFGDGNAQSAVRQFVGSGKQDERTIGSGTPGSEYPLELLGVTKP